MNRSTVKHLADLLREAMKLEGESEDSVELRKLIESLERRERELARERTKLVKPTLKKP